MFKILTIMALALAVALAATGLCLDRAAATPLAADGFRVNKSNDAGFIRLPKNLREAAARGWPVRVWINGKLAEEAGSVEALAASKTPTYRVKSGIMLYVNDALKGTMATDSVVVAADLPGKVLDWSKMALAAASLCSIFWLLRPFKPAAPAMASASTGKSRLVTLDSLRGIAAMVVMLVHAAGMFMPASWLFNVTPSPGWEQAPAITSYIRHTPLAFFLNGSLMVHLFWVMSGLVLSAPLLRTGSSQHIARSTAKRYFRLMPLAFVTTLASYFMHVGSWYSVAEFNAGTRFGVAMLAFSGGAELALSSALRDAFLFGSSYNMPLWTIKYEFLGSLFLFGLLACTLPLKRRRLLWGACLLFLTQAPGLFYLADFITGLFLADLLVNHQNVRPLGKGVSLLLAATALALGSATPGWLTALAGPVPAGGDVLFLLLPAGLLVLLTLRSEMVGSLLRLRPFIWLGERSFALYVVHALTIHLVGHGVAVWCLNQGLPPFASSAAGFGVFLAFTLWISDWLTKWIDIPSTHFANYIGLWLSGESSKPAPKSVPPNDNGSRVPTSHHDSQVGLAGTTATTPPSRRN